MPSHLASAPPSPSCSVYYRIVHHLCDAEEPEDDQEGSVKVQQGRGCRGLLRISSRKGTKGHSLQDGQAGCTAALFGTWGCFLLTLTSWSPPPFLVIFLEAKRKDG